MGRNGSVGCVAAKKPFLAQINPRKREVFASQRHQYVKRVSVELSEHPVTVNAEKYERSFSTHAVNLGEMTAVDVSQNKNNNH